MAVPGQEFLEKKLDILETHQNEIHNALLSMEADADQLYREERPLYDDEAAQRDALYARSERISAALFKIGDDLKNAVSDVNECAAGSLPPESTPVGSIVRILNNQLAALSQVRCPGVPASNCVVLRVQRRNDSSTPFRTPSLFSALACYTEMADNL